MEKRKALQKSYFKVRYYHNLTMDSLNAIQTREKLHQFLHYKNGILKPKLGKG